MVRQEVVALCLLITAAAWAEVPAGWFPFVISELAPNSVCNVAARNERPAGTAGFVQVRNGHFVDGQGRRLRFLGTNIGMSNAFPDRALAPLMAARMASLGINCVRFTHLDIGVRPRGIFDPRSGDMQHLDRGQLAKLDWVIYQLKQAGIYCNLNLKVSRTLTEADGIPNPKGLLRFQKAVDMFSRPHLAMQRDYARDLLTHRNPYTRTRYVDEPAVAMVELNNEDGFLFFAVGPVLDALPEPYKAELQGYWREYLKERYATTAALRAAWGGEPGTPGVPDGQSLEEGRVGFPALSATRAARCDWYAFIQRLETRYAEGLRGYLREDLGLRVPVTCTQAAYGCVAGLERETRMDYVDTHAYWQHPHFRAGSWTGNEWTIPNTPMTAAPGQDALTPLARCRVAGKPFSVSEYSHPAPNDYRAECMPMLAAFAGLQDWDAVFQFEYGWTPADWATAGLQSYFPLATDPAWLAFFPAAINLWRRGDMQAARGEARLRVPRSRVADLVAETGFYPDRLWNQAGLPLSAALRHRVAVQWTDGRQTSGDRVAMPPQGPFTSDTGQLSWQGGERSLFQINTPATRVALGHISGRALRLGALELQVGPTSNSWAAVALTSMDDRPLERSCRMLLTAMSRVENQRMGWSADRTTVGLDWGTGPTTAEGVMVKVRLAGRTLTAYHLDGTGTRVGRPVATGASLELTAPTLWYELTD